MFWRYLPWVVREHHAAGTIDVLLCMGRQISPFTYLETRIPVLLIHTKHLLCRLSAQQVDPGHSAKHRTSFCIILFFFVFLSINLYKKKKKYDDEYTVPLENVCCEYRVAPSQQLIIGRGHVSGGGIFVVVVWPPFIIYQPCVYQCISSDKLSFVVVSYQISTGEREKPDR